MLRRTLLAAAVLVPSVASAADMDHRYHRYPPEPQRRYVAEDHVIHCSTTHVFGLMTIGHCDGETFDPLNISGN